MRCCPIENVWEIWLIKIDFFQPNAEIGWKWPTVISSTGIYNPEVFTNSLNKIYY